MGTFLVDATSRPGILLLTLTGQMSPAEMASFVEAHDAAIDGYAGAEYRVLCDISAMRPLDGLAAEHFERAKRYSASQRNFRGSAVFATSAMVALQHRRTSVDSGVISSELISDDPLAIERHLASVRR